MKKLPKNSVKSVSTNLYLVISVPIDTKYTVVQGKKQQKWQKLPHFQIKIAQQMKIAFLPQFLALNKPVAPLKYL
jgi:hypothetical protein